MGKEQNEYTFEIPKDILKDFKSKRRILFPIELVTVPIPWELLKKDTMIKELKEKDLVLVPVPKSMVK